MPATLPENFDRKYMLDDIHTPSHMDEEMDRRELPPELLGNVMADEKAEEAYVSGVDIQPSTMSLASYAVVYHTTNNKTEPVTVPYTAWARDLVQHHVIMDHLKTHPLMGGVDWGNTLEIKKAITTQLSSMLVF